MIIPSLIFISVLKGFTHFTNNKYVICYMISFADKQKRLKMNKKMIDYSFTNNKPPKLFTNDLSFTLVSCFNPKF